MKNTSRMLVCAWALAVAGALAAGPALADKPDKKNKQERSEKHDGDRGDQREYNDRARESRGHFDDRNRAFVREYYEREYHGGKCPPGLKKKHNGCMPPGQAKRWDYGRPLARDVIYYEVPRPLVMQIGAPPQGYRYVRVDSDILMLAIGTGLVVDAIRNLGG